MAPKDGGLGGSTDFIGVTAGKIRAVDIFESVVGAATVQVGSAIAFVGSTITQNPANVALVFAIMFFGSFKISESVRQSPITTVLPALIGSGVMALLLGFVLLPGDIEFVVANPTEFFGSSIGLLLLAGYPTALFFNISNQFERGDRRSKPKRR